MVKRHPRQVTGSVLLLVSSILVLAGVLTTLGNALSGRAFTLPVGSVLCGAVLGFIAGFLLRDFPVYLETLLVSASLAALMFGMGLSFRIAAAKPGPPVFVPVLLITAGVVGLYLGRRLTKRRLFHRRSGGQQPTNQRLKPP